MLSIDVFTEKSTHGYPLDILVSALQKSIRRGDVETALKVAYELAITNTELEHHVWHRLLVISAEDIGSGNWMANVVVKSLYDTRCLLSDNTSEGDQRILMVHAIRFLCEQEKSRSSCLYSEIIKRESGLGNPIEIPDYVYDMHTTEGQKRGRKFDHFLHEAAKVIPASHAEEEQELTERLISLMNPEDL